MVNFPDAHAEAEPDRPAYIMAESGIVVTYRELVDDSRRIAQLLWSRGLRHGDCVAVLMENSAPFLKIVWAAQRIGLRYVTLSTRLLPEEIAYILGDSGAQVLFTSAGLVSTAAEAVDATPAVRHRFIVGESTREFESLDIAVGSVPDGITPDECEGVELLYSSGTTGRPKGVVTELTLKPLGTPPGVAALLNKLWGFDRETVYLSPAPLYHAGPLRFVMTVHRYGGTVVVMERFDPELALQLVDRYRVTHTQMVPTMLIRMLKLPDSQRNSHDTSSLKVVIHAAAPCPPETKRKMIDWLGPIVHEYYGSTENHTFTTLDSGEWLEHPGSVGRPLIGRLHILDDAGEELPPGEVGTIWSEGGFMFEYLNDPAKTAQARNERGWTTVGDLGYLDDQGFLYLSDRRADLIISGGVNIYPRESEDVLAMHPKVADVAVFGIPHDELGEVVHAVVQPAVGVPGDDALADELLGYCRERLSPYKCPRKIDFIGELPRHATGKLYKRLLRDRYRQQATLVVDGGRTR